MRGSRYFCQFYLVLSLIYSLKRGSNGFIAEKTILFPGGGGGGLNANFYKNPYTYLLFSRGGGVRTPYPPLDSYMGNFIITGQYLSQSGF